MIALIGCGRGADEYRAPCPNCQHDGVALRAGLVASAAPDGAWLGPPDAPRRRRIRVPAGDCGAPELGDDGWLSFSCATGEAGIWACPPGAPCRRILPHPGRAWITPGDGGLRLIWIGWLPDEGGALVVWWMPDEGAPVMLVPPRPAYAPSQSTWAMADALESPDGGTRVIWLTPNLRSLQSMLLRADGGLAGPPAPAVEIATGRLLGPRLLRDGTGRVAVAVRQAGRTELRLFGAGEPDGGRRLLSEEAGAAIYAAGDGALLVGRYDRDGAWLSALEPDTGVEVPLGHALGRPVTATLGTAGGALFAAWRTGPRPRTLLEPLRPEGLELRRLDP